MIKFFLIISSLCATLHGTSSSPALQEPAAVVILGGGVGALTSAIYLARAGIKPIVIEGPTPGGLITQSHSVQNWPGEQEITGAELAEKVRKQAEGNGAILLREEVIAVDFSKRPFTITLKNLDENNTHTLFATSVIIAMGTRPNFLAIPGESAYWGRGVTNCAICDGALYRDSDVGVVGGGDAAVIEALYLSNIARQVNVFVRKDSFRAIEGKRLAALLAKPNVKVFYRSTVEEVQGNEENVTGVLLKTAGKTSHLPLDGLFLAIGSKPNSELFKKALALDPAGYILLKKDQETSVAGIYALGDIVDPIYKQAISAAGDGAKAAMQAQQYISDWKGGIALQTIPTSSARPKREMIEITSMEQFQKELKASEVPVFVDFYATWCGPCKQITPRIESSATELAGRVKFLKVNVDQVHTLPTLYQVRSMPTALLFNKGGQIIERKVGSIQILDLLQSLESTNR